jgi:tRNA dimethylallyltransferase
MTYPASVASTAELFAIIGATASGKSALALALARRLGAELLCVDSMTVYRGMDIGTAKPTAAERAEVVHHGLDLADVGEAFTVARFVDYADGVIADCRSRGVPLVAVGGTPLYFMSLFRGLFDGPAADDALRDRLRNLGNEALHRRLTEVDPDAARRIHANDTRRLIRALEVFELTGKPITEQQAQWASGAARHEAKWVGLHWDREALNRRINARSRTMLEAGWLDECRNLGPLGPTASEATGYRELLAHLAGRQSLADAVEAIKIATRQLARRQIKWFRRFEDVRWLPGEASVDENLARVPAGT